MYFWKVLIKTNLSLVENLQNSHFLVSTRIHVESYVWVQIPRQRRVGVELYTKTSNIDDSSGAGDTDTVKLTKRSNWTCTLGQKH